MYYAQTVFMGSCWDTVKIKVAIISLKKKLIFSIFPRLVTLSPLVLALSHVRKENAVHVKSANDNDKIKLKLCHLLQTFERYLENKKVDVFSLC